MSILAQLLGQGSAGLGPGPFSRDTPPPPTPPPPLASSFSTPPFPLPVQSVDAVWGDKVAQRLSKPSLCKDDHKKKKTQSAIRNLLKKENN